MPDFIGELASDDERRALVAMRDALAQHMASSESNVVAQIAARLQAVVTRIAEIDSGGDAGDDAVDEVARQRAARRVAAAGLVEPSAGGGH